MSKLNHNVTYAILRHVLGYTDDQQLHHLFHLMTLGAQVGFLIYWHEYVWWCYEVYACVTRWSMTCIQMTICTYVLTNIFFLHITLYTHDTCHLYAWNYLLLTTKRKAIILSILKCYAKYHNPNNFQFKKNCLCWWNSIMLTVSGHDTLRPLGF